MMTEKEMTACFNEWMRQYTEDPEKFEATFRTVMEFLENTKGSKEPTYGQSCTAFMKKLRHNLHQA